MIFELPDAVTVDGVSYKIRTDFRVILEIFIMLDDPDLTDADRTEALLRMFYLERPENTEAAVEAFANFANPRRGSSKHDARLICWEQDFPLMVAPVNHILGCECRSLPELHWHSFLAAYLEIPPESVIARVLRIREKLRTGKKLEKYERTWYRKNIDLVTLRPKFSASEEEILSAWSK